MNEHEIAELKALEQVAILSDEQVDRLYPCSCGEREVCSDPGCRGPYYDAIEEARETWA